MASVQCGKCLLRPSVAIRAAPRISALTTLPFSTTASNNLKSAAGKEGPKKRPGVHQIAGKHKQVGKNKPREREKGPKPAPGERKAFRKRIVLSNNNAIPVNLSDVGKSGFSSKENIGKVLGLDSEIVDMLRFCEAFQITQSWPFFHRPAMLIRPETIEITHRMEQARNENRMLRLILTGDKVVGKSMLLMQALAHAYNNGYLILHIPEAQELVISHTEYGLIEGSNPPRWSQPMYAQKLSTQLARNHPEVLQRFTVTQKYETLATSMSKNMNLFQLANLGRDPELAWPVWEALWHELTEIEGRPPIFYSLDGLSHIMRVSDYLDKEAKKIHSHDLALIKQFCDLLSGAKPSVNGGAVIAATARSNSPIIPSVELSLQAREAEQVFHLPEDQVPKHNPYAKIYDPRVDKVLEDVEVLRVNGVSKDEARAVMEYWAASGILTKRIDELSVTETWTLGGHGVLGEMERAALHHMRM